MPDSPLVQLIRDFFRFSAVSLCLTRVTRSFLMYQGSQRQKRRSGGGRLCRSHRRRCLAPCTTRRRQFPDWSCTFSPLQNRASVRAVRTGGRRSWPASVPCVRVSHVGSSRCQGRDANHNPCRRFFFAPISSHLAELLAIVRFTADHIPPFAPALLRCAKSTPASTLQGARRRRDSDVLVAAPSCSSLTLPTTERV